MGLFLNSQCNKTFVMKNVLITIFFILSFAPMFCLQTVPEKEIDFEGSFIIDDARSASLPIEAYLQDTQVVIALLCGPFRCHGDDCIRRK